MVLAATLTAATVAQRTRTATMDHSTWSVVLEKHVGTDGLVDYVALANDPWYQRYILQLEQFRPMADTSRQEVMAYWINAYNAFSVRIIAGAFPLDRLADHPGWEDQPLYAGQDGAPITLRWIRQEALQRAFGDARISFALNSGRVDGPLLRRGAYTADALEEQLDQAARRFINDPARNRIGPETLSLSAYLAPAGDGAWDEKALRALVARYASVPVGQNVPIGWRTADDRLNRH